MALKFLFPAALWALPLASLPVILHLLFRRKSPVMPFSTLRFIKASVQRTAARKRVQKWVLLATRVALLALLIAAVAQPAKAPGGGWSAPGKSSIAAIVVDTSFSMELLQGHQPLLARADAAVRELLSGQLAGAKAAIFRSATPPADQPEQLKDASEILAEWTPLAPTASPRPLADRIASAEDLLNREHAQDKWLVIISDFQKREFTNAIPQPIGAHVVLIDLHPDDPRSAGVTRVAIDPAQPTPGIGSEAVVDIVGRPNTTRPAKVLASTLAGKVLLETPVQVATLDGAGRATLRFPLHLPAERWMLLRANLQDEDDMAWDNTRAQLIETPPRQIVAFLGNPAAGAMQRSVWLALDPNEGSKPLEWSLSVKQANEIPPDAATAVLLAEEWPDDARTARLVSFVRGGGTLIWFLRPGLEETWAQLPESRKSALASLLPSEPMIAQIAPLSTVAVSALQDPLVGAFADNRFQIHNIVIRRLIPFSADPQGTLLLNCFPQDPRPGLHPQGLLYRRSVGTGTVYTWATLPDRQYGNLNLHPLFLPLLVRMAQRPASRSDAQNIELGQPLVLSGRQFASVDSMMLQGPQGEMTLVKADRASGAPQFSAGPANAPGLYTWMSLGSNDPAAIANVQLPAAESELFYTPAASVIAPGEDVLVARSVAELHAKVANLGQPQPKWTLPIAIVLLILCAEALMASLSRLWQPSRMRAFSLHAEAAAA